MKYPVLTVIIFFVLLLFTSCTDDDCKAEPIADCVCTTEYNPVCGCDNVTYSNACNAECNNITDYSEGECM